MNIKKWMPKSFDKPSSEDRKIAELEKRIEQHIIYENYLLEKLKRVESYLRNRR